MKKLIAAIALLSVTAMAVQAAPPFGGATPDTCAATTSTRVETFASVEGAWASGSFAPRFIASGRHGTLTSARAAGVGVGIRQPMRAHGRAAWGFGADVAAMGQSGVDYARWDEATQQWGNNRRRPATLQLRELYASGRWRSVFATFGWRRRGSRLVDDRLSSGDLTHSNNAAPILQLRAGFWHFVNVPFTRGELQIDGEVAYGRFTDASWWSSHSNLYNGHLARGSWYCYRRLYVRTSPRHRWGVTIGAQAAGIFGGSTRYYEKGKLERTDVRGFKLWDLVRIQWPSGTDEDFAFGNTLGSWDLAATWRFDRGALLKAYAQMPWEDGSGMAKRNGFDALYGLELRLPGENGPLRAVVAEYLDLTNQSGPVHFAAGDYPGTTIQGQATGADDYYNNAYYNPYANYGMSLGSPAVMAPIYNADGYMAYTGNRMRAVHFGAEGCIGTRWRWRVLAGWRRAYGNGFEPLLRPVSSTSAMAEGLWLTPLRGLAITGQLAIDRGKMPSNSFGAMLRAAYTFASISL